MINRICSGDDPEADGAGEAHPAEMPAVFRESTWPPRKTLFTPELTDSLLTL